MRKTAKLILLLLLATILGLACFALGCGSDAPEEGTKSSYSVVFNSDGGTTIENQTVKNGEKVIKPIDPIKTDSKGEYEFIGWFYGETEWDFEKDVVKKDLVLVAKWQTTAINTPEYLP